MGGRFNPHPAADKIEKHHDLAYTLPGFETPSQAIMRNFNLADGIEATGDFELADNLRDCTEHYRRCLLACCHVCMRQKRRVMYDNLYAVGREYLKWRGGFGCMITLIPSKLEFPEGYLFVHSLKQTRAWIQKLLLRAPYSHPLVVGIDFSFNRRYPGDSYPYWQVHFHIYCSQYSEGLLQWLRDRERFEHKRAVHCSIIRQVDRFKQLSYTCKAVFDQRTTVPANGDRETYTRKNPLTLDQQVELALHIRTDGLEARLAPVNARPEGARLIFRKPRWYGEPDVIVE